MTTMRENTSPALDHGLERRFAEFKVSKRARSFVADGYGSLSAVAAEVRKREADPSLREFYRRGGVRDALQFGFFNSRRAVCGKKTALEIAKALLLLGAATFDDCFLTLDYYDLKTRLQFNEELKALGWTGPFLDGPKAVRRAAADTKAITLRQRIERLRAELAKAESELATILAEKPEPTP